MSKIDNQFFICKKLLTTITPAFLIITVIYIVLIGIYTYSYSEELGIMGDFIGGTLNPIFAFTSFMALLYTIKLQSETIELQIKDLKLTREELSQSRKAQQDSADTLKQQRFEMTFFSLLSLLESRIKRFELYIDGKKYECNKEDYEKHKFPFKETKSLIVNALMLVDKFDNNIDNNKSYANILSSCLSLYILQMLAFYCADDNNPDTDCIKKLIEKYSMFASIGNILAEDIKQKFALSAFQE